MLKKTSDVYVTTRHVVAATLLNLLCMTMLLLYDNNNHVNFNEE
jgi:hypothetical protein